MRGVMSLETEAKSISFCKHHQEVKADFACRRCGDFICQECSRIGIQQQCFDCAENYVVGSEIGEKSRKKGLLRSLIFFTFLSFVSVGCQVDLGGAGKGETLPFAFACLFASIWFIWAFPIQYHVSNKVMRSLTLKNDKYVMGKEERRRCFFLPVLLALLLTTPFLLLTKFGLGTQESSGSVFEDALVVFFSCISPALLTHYVCAQQAIDSTLLTLNESLKLAKSNKMGACRAAYCDSERMEHHIYCWSHTDHTPKIFLGFNKESLMWLALSLFISATLMALYGLFSIA